MDEQTRDDRARELEHELESDAALDDLSVREHEAEKVVGGVVAPCDRSKQ